MMTTLYFHLMLMVEITEFSSNGEIRNYETCLMVKIASFFERPEYIICFIFT